MLAEAACYYKEKRKTLLDVYMTYMQNLGIMKKARHLLKLEGEAGAKRIQEIMTGFRTSDMKDEAGVKAVRF